MYLVSISDLKSGEVLARAVTNANGAVLCPPGYKLTEAAIVRLRNAGIESVVVEGARGQGNQVEERLNELKERFETVDDPILLQIKAAVEKRLRFMALE